MKTKPPAALALAFALASLALALAPPRALGGAKTVSLTVDTTRTAQEIRGFGASGAWWAQEIGGWPEKQRREVTRLLYDKKSGIGLTIYRHNLGADTLDDPTIGSRWHRAESMLDTKTGKFDWSRDANARAILREAVEAGADEVYLFVNSPPVSMTINGRGHGTKVTWPDGKEKKATNLAPENYGKFSRYLGEITEHFLRVDKLPVVAVSPVNEPNVAWNTAKQEGCFYSPQQTVGVLKAALAEFTRRGLDKAGVRIEAPEAASWREALPYFQAMRGDPALRAALTDFCTHSYVMESASNAENKRKLREWFDKNCAGLRLHMSEWCDVRGGKQGFGPGMDGALPMIRVMMEDLIIGRVATWQQWVAASSVTSHDSLIHYDAKTRALTLTKRYWVMGQFSRNLPRGSVVLGLKGAGGAGGAGGAKGETPALAARRPDGSVVIICANLSASDRTLEAQFPKDDADGKKWTAVSRALTDEKNDYALSDMSGASGSAGGFVLPARSVVSVVFRKR